MRLPDRVKATRDAFINKFPYPTANLEHVKPEVVEAFEAQFRSWFGKMIQQIVFSNPNNKLGWKSSSPNNPPSKDFMASNEGTLHGWDMFGGVGTGNPTLNVDPDSIEIPGQNFIPVTPVNYLNEESTPIPPVDNPPVEGEVVVLLNQIHQDLVAQTLALVSGLNELKASVDKGIKVRF